MGEERGLGAGEARRRRRRNMGGGGSGRALKGREPRAPRTHARASPSSSRARASDHAPSTDGADVRGGGAWRPSAPLEVAGCHLFLRGVGVGGGYEVGTGNTFLSRALFVPLPHGGRAGGPGRVRKSPLRVFPPTLTL